MCIVEDAKKVLNDNSRGDYTVPNARLYPYQWLWDSGFIALGLMAVDEDRAWREISSLLKGQWANGMLPHIVYHQTNPEHKFNHETWGANHDGKWDEVPTSGISQPPVLGTIALKMYEIADDKEAARKHLSDMYDKIVRFNRWYHENRNIQKKGLVATFHPQETGMDNSPAWDTALTRAPLEHLQPYFRNDSVLGEESGSHGTANTQYDAHMSLIFYMRDHLYDQAKLSDHIPFRIIDIAINCILIRSDKDLITLGQLIGRTDYEQELRSWVQAGRDAFDMLWDEKKQTYVSYDVDLGDHIPVATSAGFLPFYAGIVPLDKLPALANTLQFWLDQVKFGVPSTDPTDPAFQENAYWRGPLWINMNWMISEGLKDYGLDKLSQRIIDDSMAVIQKEGFWEYFNPLTAKGLGANNFSWTAAIALFWAELMPKQVYASQMMADAAAG